MTIVYNLNHPYLSSKKECTKLPIRPHKIKQRPNSDTSQESKPYSLLRIPNIVAIELNIAFRQANTIIITKNDLFDISFLTLTQKLSHP